MNIRDAIRGAEKLDARGIAHKSDPTIYIYGTNSPDCCFMCTATEKIPNWEPLYDDLAANDWFVVHHRKGNRFYE